jgi:hypothetical protein
MNPTKLRKGINDYWSGPHKQPKGKWAPILLDDSYGLLRSPFVTFGVIKFVMLKSFQKYQWCRHRSFSVTLISFYFVFIFSLSYLFKNYKEDITNYKYSNCLPSFIIVYLFLTLSCVVFLVSPTRYDLYTLEPHHINPHQHTFQ